MIACPGRFTPRRARTPFDLLLLLLVAVAACRGRPDHRGGAAPDESPRYGGTLVIAGSSDLEAANTLVTGEVYTQEVLRHLLFMPLIRNDSAFGYEPWLARSWEMLGDTGVVFHLRDDVVWHDGTPTTAWDVAFTFERAKHPETAFANVESFFGRWTGVEVVDSFTVRFSFEPHIDPLAGLPLFPIMPRHLLGDVPPARLRNAEFNWRPVGNGPFRFVSYQSGDRWVFEANPDFPEELGGRPYVDRVVWRVIPEGTAQVAEILSGGVDLILGPPSADIQRLDARPDLRALVQPSRKFQFIVFNGKRSPLDDPRVRRALVMAIDRGEILEVLRAGYGMLAAGPVPPFHWAYDPELEPLPFDTAAAKALLAEAGFLDRDGDGFLEGSDGRVLEFSLTIPVGNSYNRNVAEMIQADLADIGVRMRLRPTDAAAMFADLTAPERRFDAAFLAWESDLRLSLHHLFHSSAMQGPFQMASYGNPELDRLLDGIVAATERDQALPLWRKVQEILREEQPWGVFFHTPDLYVVNERVRNVRMDMRGAFHSLPRWWLAEAGD